MWKALFVFVTEHETTEFFDRIFNTEKYRFNIDRNLAWGISAKTGQHFQV